MPAKRWQTAAAAALWIGVWQLAAMAANRSLLLPVPTPADTAAALVRLASTAPFWGAVAASLLRIGAGFVLALAAGSLGALLSWRSRAAQVLTRPLLYTVRAVPVASLTILVFLWLPRQHIPACIVFCTVLPVVWHNVEEGLTHTDPALLEMAQVFGMSRRQRLGTVVLPALRPYAAAAVATGLGFAWKSGVAAEVICRTGGSLGDLLWSGKTAVAYDEVFAVTVVIVLWSAVLEQLARRLMKGGRP